MDNDQANFQPLIPAHTVVDVRLGGEIDRFFWSFSVQNVFDELYFDYAIASAVHARHLQRLSAARARTLRLGRSCSLGSSGRWPFGVASRTTCGRFGLNHHIGCHITGTTS